MGIIGLVVLAWALATPAAAQVTCRPSPLGKDVCVGVPAPSMRGRPADPRNGRGLSGVQARPQTDTAPRLLPGWRTNAFGATFLGPADLPPRRLALPGVPRAASCKRDALGNLICR